LRAGNHPDQDCEAAGGILRTPTDNTCRYHFVDQVSVISAEERVQVFTEFDWEFTDELKYYAEASYSHNVIKRSDGGGTFNTGSATGGGFTIPAEHPFNFWTADPADPLGMIWVDPASWDPMTDVAIPVRAIARPFGIDVNHNEKTEKLRRQTDYVRFMNGIEYDFDNSWFVDGSFSFSHANRTTRFAHTYRSDVFQQLVKDGEWNPFGTRISNPGLVSPKDLVSTAGNSQITQDKFDQRGTENRRSSEWVIDLVASGELFEMGGNTVSAAIGGQYRDVSIEYVPDSLGSAGEANEEAIENFVSGSQDVTALFAELIMPFGDTVEVQLAVRQEDYGGGIGSTTDPKISAEFRPLDWLGFRGSFGTSFQAPTVRQTAAATSSAFIDDPASPTGPGGTLVCVSTGLNNNITVNVVGAPGLKPQESENFNLGVVMQTERFRASLDYWNFDYTDLIAAGETAQAIVNNDCDDDGVPNDPRVIRDAGGQLRQVNSEFVNIGRVETDGFDLNADYTMDVGNSTLIFDASATQVMNFDVDADGDGSTEFDGAGSRNFSNNFSTMPELRAHGGVTWFMGNHSANLTLRYIDSYKNDQSCDGEIESWTTLDAQYSILLPGLIGDGDTRFAIGVNNLTDEDPPALVRNAEVNDICTNQRLPLQNSSTGVFDGIDRPGYDDRAGHDIRGQIFYVRFVQGF
jgi:iron complex outermembrane receptor protein